MTFFLICKELSITCTDNEVTNDNVSITVNNPSWD